LLVPIVKDRAQGHHLAPLPGAQFLKTVKNPLPSSYLYRFARLPWPQGLLVQPPGPLLRGDVAQVFSTWHSSIVHGGKVLPIGTRPYKSRTVPALNRPSTAPPGL
jgi:hypothetical protein